MSERTESKVPGNAEMQSSAHGRFAPAVDHYSSIYSGFEQAIYEEIRREAYGEEFHQHSWSIPEEYDKFIAWLDLGPESRILDVGCGAGGPSVRLAQRTGCNLLGFDITDDAVATANSLARKFGLATRVRFERHDASQKLPLQAASFDAVICIDTVNMLSDRSSVLADWARVLKVGGRILFTDPSIVTGRLSNAEIAIRSTTGYQFFVPPGENERLIRAAGLELLFSEDLTGNQATLANRWHTARASRADILRKIEGDSYEKQQEANSDDRDSRWGAPAIALCLRRNETNLTKVVSSLSRTVYPLVSVATAPPQSPPPTTAIGHSAAQACCSPVLARPAVRPAPPLHAPANAGAAPSWKPRNYPRRPGTCILRATRYLWPRAAGASILCRAVP